MKWCVIGSFKASFIERNQTISSFEEIITIFCFWWLVIDLPKSSISLFISELVDFPIECKDWGAVFVEEFCGEIGMCRDGAIIHDICEKEQSIVRFTDISDFFSNHLYPLIKYLFQIIWRYLCTNNISCRYSSLDRLNKIIFVCFDTIRDDVCPDIRRDGIECFWRDMRGRFSPFDSAFFEERQCIARPHDSCLDRVDDAEKWWEFLSSVEVMLDIMKKLRKHLIR